ncbi:MAG: bifunctional metallophosphatase/5'-nucleotidase [Calditrichaeota bacterium]|nr:bifunctional metallophosphatase/5'-nucleotidase [Calditrichota bacterium]
MTRSVLLTILFLFCGQAPAVELTLYYWSDRVAQGGATDIAIGDERRMAGGVAALGGMLKTERSGNPATLTLAAGGELAGSFPAYSTRGASEVEVLKRLGVDVFTPGVADFAWDWEDLQKALKKSSFAVVVANAGHEKSGRLFKPDTLLERGGVRIAVSGVVPVSLGEVVLRSGLEGVSIDSPEEALSRVLKARDGKADLVVVLSQLGLVEDSLLAVSVKGIDVIIGGHYPRSNDIEPRRIGRTWIVPAPTGGTYLGRSRLEYDADRGGLIGLTAEQIPLTADLPHDDDLARYEAFLEKKHSTFGKKVLGQLQGDWLVEGKGPSATRFHRWVCDELRRTAASAQLALLDRSSLRKGISEGPITERHLIEAAPIPTPVVVFQLTGEELFRITRRKTKVPRLIWSGLTAPSRGDTTGQLRVGDYIVRPEDTFAVITTGQVWDRFTELTGLVRTDRPALQLPIKLQDVMREGVQRQKVIVLPQER